MFKHRFIVFLTLFFLLLDLIFYLTTEASTFGFTHFLPSFLVLLVAYNLCMITDEDLQSDCHFFPLPLTALTALFFSQLVVSFLGVVVMVLLPEPLSELSLWSQFFLFGSPALFYVFRTYFLRIQEIEKRLKKEK
ncbi:MAG: hypothetical protein RLZZ301_1254 [Bacteroidota bacterium]|jgi:hypothetical protein